MLQKKNSPAGSRLKASLVAAGAIRSLGVMDRRSFLRNSGMSAIAVTALSQLPASFVRKAEAQSPPPEQQQVELRKTICPFCSVGCCIIAEVENGVWVGQEPAFESPVNMGTHCAKGAATRDLAIGHRRTKYPTKLVDGRWERISWQQAIDEIGDKLLQIREESGPDSVYWLGSAKYSNEQGYLARKFVSLWGTNNTDNQARICHSTTVSGVANMYGYGAMTNSFNDIHLSKSIFLLGGNPAEAHPVSMLHLLHAKENGAHLIVVDPRFTRTAAHATEYVRIRAGTDVAFLWGLLWIILENSWEEKEYIQQRVYGFERLREVVAEYPPDEVERITGVSREQMERVARLLVENRPGTLIWCMGLTQSHIGSSKTRAAATFQLVLGNIGVAGGGANIFRGHDNIQGTTDLGTMCHTLPAYYGLSEDAWRHWSRVWDLDYEWVKSRFASKDLMERAGMPVSRWFDGVLEDPENLDQPNPIRAMIYWGHAVNSQTRNRDVKRALEKVELLVQIDPHPGLTAVLGDRRDGVYVLPAASTMEMAGSATNSQRAVQWREKVVEPMFEAKTDYEITYLFARKFGYHEELFKHIAIEKGVPVVEDILREINRGSWTIGYTGQSPERLKQHMQHQGAFHTTSLRGSGDPVEGEYYGLPWPCWGTAELKHPGTPNLYDTSKPVAEGGLPFRANWGVQHEGANLLAEGSYPAGSELTDGYPEITYAVLEAMGWHKELTAREQLVIAAIAADTYSQELLTLEEEEAAQRLDELLRQEVDQQAREEAQRLETVDPTSADAALSDPATASSPLTLDQLPQSGRAAEAAIIYQRLSPIAAAGSKEVKEESDEPGADVDQGVTRGAHSEEPDAEGQDVDSQQDAEDRQDQKGEDGQESGAPEEEEESFARRLLKVSWKIDLSGGIQRVALAHGLAPFGNGKARINVWNFPDPIPLHREPLYTPRRDLLPKYRTYDDKRDYRLPLLYWTIQKEDYSQDFPLILTSGRIVEHEGGGDETRSNMWLAEFAPRMYVEINPADASALGIADGSEVWLATPEGARVRIAAWITRRVAAGTVFMPFHFGGWFQGEDLSGRYPPGTVPYVVGEAANTAMTYGYDVVDSMQESKVTLCRIEAI